jgi:Carbohydrate binding domain
MRTRIAQAFTVLSSAVAVVLALHFAPSADAEAPMLPSAGRAVSDQRWVRLEGNLSVDSVSTILDRARAAKAAGANTVMFSDTKLNLWFASPDLTAQWLPRMQELAAGVRAQGLKLVLQSVPVGYCTPVLFSDPNLTTGYPFVDAPFTVRNGQLVPDQTASFANGSFEQATANSPNGWDPDSPGRASFVDTSTAHEGRASLRFEAKDAPNNQARAFTQTNVKPNQQYLLRFWAKTENLSAGYLGPYVVDASGNRLTDQHYSYGSETDRTYTDGTQSLTTDWTEMKIPFNTHDATTVRVALGAWGGTGKLWVDDVRLENTPLLNVVRRDNLPLTAKTVDGQPLTEDVDMTEVVDPQLGQIFYSGNFDTYHREPVVRVARGSRLSEGDRVLISGYHAQVTTGGQVGCSWHDPRVIALMKEIHRQADSNIGADGYLIDLEEVRTGGWEPADAEFGSSAASLAAHGQQVINDAAEVTGKPIYVWSDMFDPQANAVSSFYQVKGSLVGTAEAMNPATFTMVVWKDGDEAATAKATVAYFAQLGFQQLNAAFYDRDVSTNFTSWSTATEGRPGIVGSMYTTFINDYSKLPEFGELWWPSGEANSRSHRRH